MLDQWARKFKKDVKKKEHVKQVKEDEEDEENHSVSLKLEVGSESQDVHDWLEKSMEKGSPMSPSSEEYPGVEEHPAILYQEQVPCLRDDDILSNWDEDSMLDVNSPLPESHNPVQISYHTTPLKSHDLEKLKNAFNTQIEPRRGR
jgi:hypothetical protein